MITMTLMHPATTEKSDSCANLVGKALATDRFDLDEFPLLSELPAVERFAAAHPHALLPRGKAIQTLLQRAVTEVATAYAEDADRTLRRIAAYVRLRYQEGKSVRAIAEEWGVERSALSHQLSRRALLVVTHRFLQLAQSVRWAVDERTTAQAS